MSNQPTDAGSDRSRTSAPSGPVVIDLGQDEDQPPQSPATAPPVPDPQRHPEAPATMEVLARLADRPKSPMLRWFLGLGGALLSAIVALAVWTAIEVLFARSAILGGAVALLLAGVVITAMALVVFEMAALSRLSQVEKIRVAADRVRTRADLEAARKLVSRLSRFYAGRKDLRWQSDGLNKALSESFDADAALDHAEQVLMTPLDALALKEVEAASRQVATVTALVPLALADLLVALLSNLRMIRRIAEIYGGRAGTVSSWQLTRAVLRHLVATGALAVGDDLIGSIAGGGVMSHVSRRFGEGVVNGALTARVGIAAMDVCRPLPFHRTPRPSVGKTIQRALVGVFTSSGAQSKSNRASASEDDGDAPSTP